jgi:hypothetical protein
MFFVERILGSDSNDEDEECDDDDGGENDDGDENGIATTVPSIFKMHIVDGKSSGYQRSRTRFTCWIFSAVHFPIPTMVKGKDLGECSPLQ